MILKIDSSFSKSLRKKLWMIREKYPPKILGITLVNQFLIIPLLPKFGKTKHLLISYPKFSLFGFLQNFLLEWKAVWNSWVFSFSWKRDREYFKYIIDNQWCETKKQEGIILYWIALHKPIFFFNLCPKHTIFYVNNNNYTNIYTYIHLIQLTSHWTVMVQ